MSLPPPETDYVQPPDPGAVEDAPAQAQAEIVASRRARRRAAVNARRVDVAIGVLAGIAVVVFVPGIALAGIIAVVVLLAVGLSLLYRRLRAGRAARSRGRR